MGRQTGLTDDELVARVLAGDREAFAPLVARHAGVVRLVTRRYFPHGDAALDYDDLCQEVFVRAYTRLASYRPTGRFGAWLSSVGRNYCIDCGRRHHHSTVPHEAGAPRPDPLPGPEERALSRELGDAIAAALATLPRQQARAVALCDVRGLTLQEAGAAAGLPAGTVKMQAYRGRKALRAALAGRADGGAGA